MPCVLLDLHVIQTSVEIVARSTGTRRPLRISRAQNDGSTDSGRDALLRETKPLVATPAKRLPGAFVSVGALDDRARLPPSSQS